MLRILHLEDDIADVVLVRDMLEAEEIDCDIANVKTEGEFRAALQQGGFDLILADYSLPSFNGLLALQITRQQYPDLPFIFLSGRLGEEIAIDALKVGATDYVLKTRLARLAPAICRALREAEEVCERKKTEKQLTQERERLKLVIEFTNSVATNLELQEIFRAASAGVHRVMKCDSVCMSLPDREAKNMGVVFRDFPKQNGSFDKEVVPIQGSINEKVFVEGKPLVVNDLEEITMYPEEYRRAKGEGPHCACLLPLISRNRVLGVLSLARVSGQRFEDEEVAFLLEIANQLALALENALIYEQTTALKDKLVQEKLFLEDEIRALAGEYPRTREFH